MSRKMTLTPSRLKDRITAGIMAVFGIGTAALLLSIGWVGNGDWIIETILMIGAVGAVFGAVYFWRVPTFVVTTEGTTLVRRGLGDSQVLHTNGAVRWTYTDGTLTLYDAFEHPLDDLWIGGVAEHDLERYMEQVLA